MSTISLSLPSEQISFIDKLTNTFGFANRSEFIRNILRVLSRRQDILAETISYPFVAPKEKSSKKILADFVKTKKYSSAFLKDLKEGLESSNYFTN